MSYTTYRTLPVAHDKNSLVPNLDCPMSLSSPDGFNFISFSGYVMAVTTLNATLVGTQVRTVRVTKSGPGFVETMDLSLTIVIVAKCELSALIQVFKPSDMSTPVFGNVFQDLSQLFTHQHAGIWAAGTCVISFYIQDGDTSYLKCYGTADSVVKTTLHLYPFIFANEGTHSTTVVAYYAKYTDQVKPTKEQASDSFLVTVEPECKITSFKNNPNVSKTLETNYIINTAAVTFPFDIRYEPNDCKYIKNYVFTVNGIAASPAWLSVDSSTKPHMIKIQSNNVSHEGTYTIGVLCSTNTTPKYVSTEQYIFKASLSYNTCSSIIFDAKTLTTMNFKIAQGAPVTSTSFFTHSNSIGKFECGPRQYRLISTYAGLTFEGQSGLTYNDILNKNLIGYNKEDELKFTFQTTDPGAVGTHKIELLVETVNYPLFNSVLFRVDEFNIVVTASCWDTVMQYTPPSSQTHIVRQPLITYQIPEALIKDTVSTNSAPYDGKTYCGPRNFMNVKLTSREDARPDSSWLSFDGFDTYFIKSTSNSQWGHYQVFFGVKLKLYPDFVPQNFMFEVEIVPACAESKIAQAKDIVFKPLNRNQINTVDIAGFFTHTMEGDYSSYCGSLNYVLNATIPVQTYLKYDGATLLTFEPLEEHAAGNSTVVLQVYLAEYPNVNLTVPIQLEITACDIQGYYADTVNGETISPARQNATKDNVFIIGEDLKKTFNFTFDDFDVTQTVCVTSYAKQYFLYLDGVDVSASLPNWITNFNPQLPEFKVFSLDQTNKGNYTLTVKAALLMNPANKMSKTQIDFKFELIVNPCLLAKLNPVTIKNMEFKIKSGMVPITQLIPEVTSSIAANSCGPVKYSLTWNHPSGALSLDQATRKLTLWTQTGIDVGTHQAWVLATLRDYPSLSPQIDVIMTFSVKIDSDCLKTEFLPIKLDPIYYIDGNEPTYLQIVIRDLVSTYNGGKGYELCGNRIYRLSQTVFHSIEPNIGGVTQLTLYMKTNKPVRRLEAEDNFQKLSEQDLDIIYLQFYNIGIRQEYDGIVENQMIKVTITASLEQYPSVAPFSVDVDTYFLKPCIYQGIGTVRYNLPMYVFSNGVGLPKIRQSMEPFFIEVDYFFKMKGAHKLRDLKVCGEILWKIYFYEGGQIDKQKKIPKFLESGWNSSKEIPAPQILIKTDDDSDAGEYNFMLCFYIPGNDPPARLSQRLKSILRPMQPFKVKIASKAELQANNPPQTIQEPPDNIVVRVAYSNNISQADYTGNKYFFTAMDIDQGAKLSTNIEIISSSPGFNITECTLCFKTKHVGLDGEKYVPRTEFGSMYEFAGIPNWVWHYMTLSYSITDGIQPLVKQLSISYVPHSYSVNKLSFDEFKALIPGGSGFQVVDKANKTDIGQSTFDGQQSDKTEGSIQVVDVDTKPLFDIEAFLSTYRRLFSEGADFSENSPNYRWLMKELQKFPFPFPIVTKFTYAGDVQIDFSREIYLPSKDDLPAYVQELIQEKWLELNLISKDGSNVILGEAYYDASQFNQTSARRLLNKNADVTQQPQKEKIIDKNFIWTVSSLQATKMHLQVTFNQPSQISSDILDRMQIQFKTPEKWLIGKGGAFQKDIEIKQRINILRQQDEDRVQMIQSTSKSISTAMQVASISNLVLAAFTSQSLQTVWSSISSLQLTIHLPLNSINFPTPVEIMFEQLISAVNFDILQSLEQFGFKLEYDVSPTLPFNDSFKTLGYSVSEPIALLGSINFILAFMLIKIIWFCTPRRFFCKNCQQREQLDSFYTSNIRFSLQTTFALLICSGAVLYPRDGQRLLDIEEKTSLDNFLIGYSIFITVLAAAFMTFTCFVTLCMTNKSVNLIREIKLRKGQPLINELKKKFSKFVISPSPPLRKQNTGNKLKEMKMIELEAELEKETLKNKYFAEFFEDKAPESRLAQQFYLVYLIRRSLLVFIALQFENTPGIQIIAIVFISLINQVYLLSEQLFKNRLMYWMEVMNDFTVYVASIFALSLTATETDEAKNALGITLVCIVVINLVMNMMIIIGGMCVSLKLYCVRKIQIEQIGARNWDFVHNAKLKCNCQCYTCGAVPTKTTQFNTASQMKELKATPVTFSSFALKLLPCELLPIVENNQIVPEPEEKDEIKLKSKVEIRKAKRQPIIAKNLLDSSKDSINCYLEETEVSQIEIDSDFGVNDFRQVNIVQVLRTGVDSAIQESKSQLLIGSCEDSENEIEGESEEEFQVDQVLGTNKQMRYRYWLKEYFDNFDQVYSPVAIKKKRDDLEELVCGDEQFVFKAFVQDSSEEESDTEELQNESKPIAGQQENRSSDKLDTIPEELSSNHQSYRRSASEQVRDSSMKSQNLNDRSDPFFEIIEEYKKFKIPDEFC